MQHLQEGGFFRSEIAPAQTYYEPVARSAFSREDSRTPGPSAQDSPGPPAPFPYGPLAPFPTGLPPPFLQAFGPLSYRPLAPFPTGLQPPFLQAFGPLSYRPLAPFFMDLWPLLNIKNKSKIITLTKLYSIYKFFRSNGFIENMQYIYYSTFSSPLYTSGHTMFIVFELSCPSLNRALRC